MAKFSGKVGFIIPTDDGYGLWTDVVIEKTMRGDLLRLRNDVVADSSKVNDDMILSATISLIANKFLHENFQHVKYINYMGVNWKVSGVRINGVRWEITTGGIYNGTTA